MNRRLLIQCMAGCSGAMIVNNILGCNHYEAVETQAMTWLMPDESEPHDRTWMAFGASRAIWGQQLLPEVQNNLATIAKAIAHYEPVSMLVRPEEYEIAAQKCGSSVNLVVSALDDLWIRDTGPVFVKDSRGRLGGIDFNFNGWGQNKRMSRMQTLLNFIIQESGVQPIQTSLVLEGVGLKSMARERPSSPKVVSSTQIVILDCLKRNVKHCSNRFWDSARSFGYRVSEGTILRMAIRTFMPALPVGNCYCWI